MWNTEGKIREQRMALAGGGYAEQEKPKREGKLSCAMAMVVGILVTLEIMVAGAMMLNIDVRGADRIAIILVFMVLYFGIVAMLTDK